MTLHVGHHEYLKPSVFNIPDDLQPSDAAFSLDDYLLKYPLFNLNDAPFLE